LTDGALFAAGPPDVEDEEQSVVSLAEPDTQQKLAEQSAAFEGARGAVLLAVAPDDGRRLAAYRLDSLPRFDGMIAAGGRIYLSTVDGKVLCLGSERGDPLEAAAQQKATRRPPEPILEETPQPRRRAQAQ
jgi:hypothetical protein